MDRSKPIRLSGRRAQSNIEQSRPACRSSMEHRGANATADRPSSLGSQLTTSARSKRTDARKTSATKYIPITRKMIEHKAGRQYGGGPLPAEPQMFKAPALLSLNDATLYDNSLERSRPLTDMKEQRRQANIKGQNTRTTTCAPPNRKPYQSGTKQPAFVQSQQGKHREKEHLAPSYNGEHVSTFDEDEDPFIPLDTDLETIKPAKNSSRATLRSNSSDFLTLRIIEGNTPPEPEADPLLESILRSMNNKNQSVNAEDDEGEYVNLWDSKSGASSDSFSANQQIMTSLMRTKGRQNSRDFDRRKAMICSTEDPYLMSSSSEQEAWKRESISNLLKELPDIVDIDNGQAGLFDMKKFENLKAKAESLDLQLTDFEHFGDLKHSLSLLELSQIFSQDCKYSCHEDCEHLILDSCKGAKATSEEYSKFTDLQEDVNDTDSGYSGSGGTAGFTLTKEEICSRIQQYNERRGSNAFSMPMGSSDAFQGPIHVCISIDRPINMSLSSRPTSIHKVLHRTQSPQSSPENTTSPVMLPKDDIKGLHISSTDTASEVVSTLLNKYNITDNPRGFAMFEQTVEDGKEIKLRKIADQEKPLLNFLRWSTDSQEIKQFVLKENDSGEIMWEAFSIPELGNFLRVLDLEELEYKKQIQNKYIASKKQIEMRMQEIEMARMDKRH